MSRFVVCSFSRAIASSNFMLMKCVKQRRNFKYRNRQFKILRKVIKGLVSIRKILMPTSLSRHAMFVEWDADVTSSQEYSCPVQICRDKIRFQISVPAN